MASLTPASRRAALALAAWTCLLSAPGCGTLNHFCHDEEPAPPLEPLPVVHVGGVVQYPQAIPIPPTGLTIRKALMQAGGIGRGNLDDQALVRRLLIALQRGRGAKAQTWYFDVPSVMEALPGDIPMVAGDELRAVTYDQTSLRLQSNAAGGDASSEVAAIQVTTVTPSGRIAVEGRLLGGSGRDAAQIQFALCENAAPEAAALVFSRRSADGIGSETYILYRDVLPDAVYGTASVRPGDRYAALRYEQIPIVMTAIVEPLIRERLEATLRERIAPTGHCGPYNAPPQSGLDPEGSLQRCLGEQATGLHGQFRAQGAAVSGHLGRLVPEVY